MQFKLVLATSLAIAASITSAAGAALTNSATEPTVHLFRRTCADPQTALPFLRAFNTGTGDHFYTTNAAEMQNAVAGGYTFEGNAGRIFPSISPFTVPLYRVFNSAVSDHFYTTSLAERNNVLNAGYTDEGIAGYVYSDPDTQTVCSSIPLYRLYNSGTFDHFYTQSATERNSAANSGYIFEGIAAYVLPA